MIAGPSGCGKTTFLKKMLFEMLTSRQIEMENIVWFNAIKAAIPSYFENRVKICEKIPDNFDEIQNNSVLIFDDLMTDAYTKPMCELFTKGYHHRNLTIVLITQNVFHQGRFCRDIALNCRYLVMFKNPRDKSQILPLARQIYPECPTELMRVYNEVTSKPHGYLLFDLTQTINDVLRFRTDIFNKNYITCFCPKFLLDKNDNEACKKYETFDGQSTFVIHA